MTDDARRVLAAALIAVTAVLGLLWARASLRWWQCQGRAPVVAFWRGAFMGSPSDLECLAVALDDGTDESPVGTTTTLWFPPSSEPATTTTVDPAVIAERERVEAERQRAEDERQAAIDACWAAHDAEWAAWDEAYNAWGEQTDGQGDYEAWLEDHPQPVTPDCGE